MAGFAYATRDSGAISRLIAVNPLLGAGYGNPTMPEFNDGRLAQHRAFSGDADPMAAYLQELGWAQSEAERATWLPAFDKSGALSGAWFDKAKLEKSGINSQWLTNKSAFQQFFSTQAQAVNGGYFVESANLAGLPAWLSNEPMEKSSDFGDLLKGAAFVGGTLLAGAALAGSGIAGAATATQAGGTGLTIGAAGQTGLTIPAIGASSLGVTAPASALLSPSLALTATGSIAEVAKLGSSWLPSPSQAKTAIQTGGKLLGGGGGAALPQPKTASGPNAFFFKESNMDLLKNNAQEVAQQGVKPMNAGAAPPIVDAGVNASPLVLLLVAATVLYFMQKG